MGQKGGSGTGPWGMGRDGRRSAQGTSDNLRVRKPCCGPPMQRSYMQKLKTPVGSITALGLVPDWRMGSLLSP